MQCCGLWCGAVDANAICLSVLHGGQAIVIHAVRPAPGRKAVGGAPRRVAYCGCRTGGVCPYISATVSKDTVFRLHRGGELRDLLRRLSPAELVAQYDADHAEAKAAAAKVKGTQLAGSADAAQLDAELAAMVAERGDGGDADAGDVSSADFDPETGAARRLRMPRAGGRRVAAAAES
eukprot:gene2927-16003_t